MNYYKKMYIVFDKEFNSFEYNQYSDGGNILGDGPSSFDGNSNLDGIYSFGLNQSPSPESSNLNLDSGFFFGDCNGDDLRQKTAPNKIEECQDLSQKKTSDKSNDKSKEKENEKNKNDEKPNNEISKININENGNSDKKEKYTDNNNNKKNNKKKAKEIKGPIFSIKKIGKKKKQTI